MNYTQKAHRHNPLFAKKFQRKIGKDPKTHMGKLKK